jgi:hypothetical protein
MNKELMEFIADEIKNYKRYKAVLETIQNEIPGIQAAVITDMPRAITNKFHSSTESQALFNRDESELKQNIKRIEIWLGYLNDEERHVTEEFYIHNRSYAVISHRWSKENNAIYSSAFWKYKRKQALRKICDLFMQNNS